MFHKPLWIVTCILSMTFDYMGNFTVNPNLQWSPLKCHRYSLFKICTRFFLLRRSLTHLSINIRLSIWLYHNKTLTMYYGSLTQSVICSTLIIAEYIFHLCKVIEVLILQHASFWLWSHLPIFLIFLAPENYNHLYSSCTMILWK